MTRRRFLSDDEFAFALTSDVVVEFDRLPSLYVGPDWEI